MIGIYKITNPSGKIYIGQSVNIKKRFNQYKRMSCITQTKLLNSFKKYGVDNHLFEILCECSKDELNSLEVYYGNKYYVNSNNGLNIRGCGGSRSSLSESTKTKISEKNKGKLVSKEVREKISKTLLGNTPWNKGIKTGKPAWNKGFKLSQLDKENISKKLTGKIGNKSNSAKIILQLSIDGTILKKWSGAIEVQRELGFKCAVVNRCARGERNSAYGFKWIYE